jgi:recyclin-1
LNRYYDWAISLRSAEIRELFSKLKEIGNLYVVDAKGLKGMIQESRRFEGVLRVEEIHEFLKARSDWSKIKGTVSKGDSCVVS